MLNFSSFFFFSFYMTNHTSRDKLYWIKYCSYNIANRIKKLKPFQSLYSNRMAQRSIDTKSGAEVGGKTRKGGDKSASSHQNSPS